ncbi:anthranilate phosphoribosyltransferase [Parasphingorhabdus sp.]|uniref:anthranilate phosphoribosyltransferase n=2 Tax=Parasphingorhabdus sp. TaxID=2709688 RepID=UPI003265AFCD
MTLADPSHPLNTQQAQSAFSKILDGECPADEVSAFLVALADRGETATEIAVAASEMRKRMVTADAPENAIDVCGTGGDGSHSLNISTAAALVVAACDVPMAKHGNRAASSKSGAADTLEALGLDLAKAATGGEESLRDVGIGFFFAPNHHPALGPLVPVRKAIGRRTIFNLLGPLCNPARVKRQLIGVATPDLVRTYADAALQLGYEKAMIVSGEEGLDELSISGPSKVAIVERGQITESRICPKDVGLPSHPADAIKGGDPAYNAAALEKLLLGEASAYRDAVLLNSAAGLLVAGEVESWEAGVEEAAEAIDKGLANALLKCWIANQ